MKGHIHIHTYIHTHKQSHIHTSTWKHAQTQTQTPHTCIHIDNTYRVQYTAKAQVRGENTSPIVITSPNREAYECEICSPEMVGEDSQMILVFGVSVLTKNIVCVTCAEDTAPSLRTIRADRRVVAANLGTITATSHISGLVSPLTWTQTALG